MLNKNASFDNEDNAERYLLLINSIYSCKM